METVGEIRNGQILKEYHGQGFIYKNFEAFKNKTADICYVPEYSGDELGEYCTSTENNTTYTYNDFLLIAQEAFKERGFKGKPEVLAELLFEHCDWQSPETLIDEWGNAEEFNDYPETHGINK